MGEYASYRGEHIKSGTCTMMYYLRWEQRKEVVSPPGNVNPVTQVEKIWFRAPRRREDGIAPGMFEFNGWCGVEPIRFRIKPECKRCAADVREIAIGQEHSSQVVNKKIGVVCNVPCYHGHTGDLPKGMFYNGFNSNVLGVAGLSIRNGFAAALIGCLACGDTFMYIDFEELVRCCEPFADEREDWEYMLEQMMEIEATKWMDGSWRRWYGEENEH